MIVADSSRNVSAVSCDNGANRGNPPFLGRGLHRPGKVSLRILQINVEGWTSAKLEILRQITEKHFANRVFVQETHQTRQDQLKLCGFQLADCILNAHHGIATFVKNNLNFSHVGKSDDHNPTEWISIKLENTTIVNVYYPPATLDITSLPIPTESLIAAGDRNCRHMNWGYSGSSLNEKNLADWAATNNLLTPYYLKQPASLILGRWQQ